MMKYYIIRKLKIDKKRKIDNSNPIYFNQPNITVFSF